MVVGGERGEGGGVLACTQAAVHETLLMFLLLVLGLGRAVAHFNFNLNQCSLL